jgi:hypothetical protein
MLIIFFPAYNEDDIIMLQLSLNFVRALVAASPESKLGNVAQLVQQVFVGADFSEGDLRLFYKLYSC